MLQFGQHIVESQEGVQQGDPLGPLLFSLAVHPLLLSLASDMAFGYLDDFTLGGPIEVVAADVAAIMARGASLGLSLNRGKCEVVGRAGHACHHQFADFCQLTPESASLLGSPLLAGPAMDDILTAFCEDLELAIARLKLISAHDALTLLKSCLGGTKLQYIMRTSPCYSHHLLPSIDNLLRSAISSTCNISLNDDQWLQASLPVWSGGLGVRGVTQLASSAFLASAAGTLPLQTLILRNGSASNDDITHASNHWHSVAGLAISDSPPVGGQRVLDSIVVGHTFETLCNKQSTQYHKARLLAAAADHSGDWLHAIPISACGLRLSDESVRLALALRLGVEVCHPFTCICDTMVDAFGSHTLSCVRGPGRSQRHHFINDLIARSLSKAGYPSIKEPHGLIRSDGKRPDGLTLIPWREGRCATWDVTVTHTVAASYLAITSSSAAAAAEAAARRKEEKYAEISRTHLFFPIAFETLGPINRVGTEFLSTLGHRLSLISDDPRESYFLFQRLSIAIQRFNAVCFSSSFGEAQAQFLDQQGHT